MLYSEAVKEIPFLFVTHKCIEYVCLVLDKISGFYYIFTFFSYSIFTFLLFFIRERNMKRTLVYIFFISVDFFRYGGL